VLSVRREIEERRTPREREREREERGTDKEAEERRKGDAGTREGTMLGKKEARKVRRFAILCALVIPKSPNCCRKSNLRIIEPGRHPADLAVACWRERR